MDANNVVHKSGLNEELGATAVMGSQVATTFPEQRYDGVLGIWYGKAPGLDRAGDAIRHAQYAGTHENGGVLALTGDDPSNKSSTLPSASELTLADLHLPILHPGNVQEVLDLGRHGVHLSRTAGLWSAVKIVTAVADGSGTAEVGPERIAPVIPTFEWNGKPYRPRVTGRLGGNVANSVEREIHEARSELARLYGIENRLNRITHNPSDAWLGIVSTGRCYHEVLAAAKSLGLDEEDLTANGIRVLQMSMPYPFDREIARTFARGLEEVLVVEEKRPFIESQLREALYGMPGAPRIVGKRDGPGPDPHSHPRRHRRRSAHRAPAVAGCSPSSTRPASPPDRSPRRPPADHAGGQEAHRVAPVTHPLLLLRLPPLDRDQGPGGLARRFRHRLPRARRTHGARPGWQDHGQHPDGGRGRPLDRYRAVRRCRPLHPEPGRRHLRPLGLAVHPGRGGRRKPHDVQDPLQRRGGHDRPGRTRPGPCPSRSWPPGSWPRGPAGSSSPRTRPTSTRASACRPGSTSGTGPGSSRPRRPSRPSRA